MLKDLLALAANEAKIVGFRVQPGNAASFQVHVWIGPNLGERLEWFEDYSVDVDRTDAIDHIAARALQGWQVEESRGRTQPFAWSGPAANLRPAA